MGLGHKTYCNLPLHLSLSSVPRHNTLPLSTPYLSNMYFSVLQKMKLFQSSDAKTSVLCKDLKFA